MNDLEQTLKKVKYFLLDMDGTVYLGDKVIGETDKTLDKIRQSGRKIIYLTNNSSKSRKTYEDKLKKMNLYRNGDEVYSSGMAAAEFLVRERKDKTVCLLGTAALKAEFEEKGIILTDKNPDICVLAYDTELTYAKLCAFTDGLFGGAEYIATHPDAVCPADGYSVPDAGAFAAMIEVATGRKPDKIIGKPYTGMGEELKSRFSAENDEFIMIGDRLHTDIAFGVNCGFHTALVLSGESTAEQAAKLKDKKPEFILNKLDDISNITL